MSHEILLGILTGTEYQVVQVVMREIVEPRHLATQRGRDRPPPGGVWTPQSPVAGL